MTECSENTCVQRTRIALLDENKKSMAKNIEQINHKIDNISSDMTTIKNFILTLPLNFVSKIEYEKLERDTTDFKNSINVKLAFASGVITIVTWVGIFIANKLF